MQDSQGVLRAVSEEDTTGGRRQEQNRGGDGAAAKQKMPGVPATAVDHFIVHSGTDAVRKVTNFAIKLLLFYYYYYCITIDAVFIVLTFCLLLVRR